MLNILGYLFRRVSNENLKYILCLYSLPDTRGCFTDRVTLFLRIFLHALLQFNLQQHKLQYAITIWKNANKTLRK